MRHSANFDLVSENYYGFGTYGLQLLNAIIDVLPADGYNCRFVFTVTSEKFKLNNIDNQICNFYCNIQYCQPS